MNQNAALYIFSFISDMSVLLNLYYHIGLFFEQARLLISNLTCFLLLSKMIQRVPLFHQNLISPVTLLRQVHKLICKIEGGEGGVNHFSTSGSTKCSAFSMYNLTCLKIVNSKLCCLDMFH